MKELHNKATKVFKVCILLILIYTMATLVFAIHTLGSADARNILFEMLHSAAISALLALGGALLLDAELNRH